MITASIALFVMSDPQDGPISFSCTSLVETWAILGQRDGDLGNGLWVGCELGRRLHLDSAAGPRLGVRELLDL